jgi:tRNA (cytidine/uridine-2'-O-)-methyltransferase
LGAADYLRSRKNSARAVRFAHFALRVLSSGMPRPAPFCLALYQPDIPQNAGTMLRLCACLGLDAALIEPAGFPTTDRHFRRAGMDYLDHVRIDRHISWRAFEDWRQTQRRRLALLTTRAALPYTDFVFEPGDIVMVGRESAGVPDEVHAAAEARLRVPVRAGLRSLNVAVAAAMVLGEALRQSSGFETRTME